MQRARRARDVLDSTIGDFDIRRESAHGQRPARVRVPIELEGDVRFPLHAGEDDRRCHPEVVLSLFVVDDLHVERVFDREEVELRTELRTARPEVPQSLDNLIAGAEG